MDAGVGRLLLPSELVRDVRAQAERRRSCRRPQLVELEVPARRQVGIVGDLHDGSAAGGEVVTDRAAVDLAAEAVTGERDDGVADQVGRHGRVF